MKYNRSNITREKETLSKVKAISTTAIVAIIAAIVVVAGLAWYLTLPPPRPEIKNPGTIIVATIGEPETLDPACAYDTASAEVIFNVYETLIFFKGEHTDEFEPRIASEVPTLENGLISEDGLTYTFPIREGIKFSNGDPVTPEDVEYSLERVMVRDVIRGPAWMLLEPLLGVYTTRDGDGNIVVSYEDIDKAVEVSGNNVILHLAKPYPPLLCILAQSWSSIVSKKWCIEQGDWDGTGEDMARVNGVARTETPLVDKMMGSGPFKLDYWEHGVEVALVRNDNYWQGPAKIERVVIKKVDEWATRKLMFTEGDADIVYVPPAHYPELEGVEGIRYVPDLPELVCINAFFNFNISSESPYVGSGKLDGEGIPLDFFSDINVRLAFAHSFDWDTYIDEALLGYGKQPATCVVEGLAYYNPDQEKYSFDLSKAEEYFKKAWNGELWEKGFKMTITYNIGNEPRRIACEMFAENVHSINDKFNIDVLAVEWPTFLGQLSGRTFTICILGWLADFPDPHNFVFPYMHSEGDFAWSQSYSNPTVDALIEEGVTTVDPARRREIYYELQRIYHEEVISLPLYQPVGRHYERDWVKGWFYNPIFPGTYFYYLEKAY